MSLLVIIPCFNEALSIEKTILSVLDKKPDALIVVVDNGSTDDTASKASKLNVRVLSEPRPGKGFAFRRGLSVMTPEITSVLMVDGDATYGMEGLLEAIEMVTGAGYDMVVGIRHPSSDHSGERAEHYRPGHIFGNKLLTLVFRNFFKIKISDTLSGWRVFSPQFLYSFHGGNSGFELETELNVHVKTVGALMAEIPVSYHGRLEGSESKLSTFHDGWKILRKNVQLVKNERPIFAFGALASPWVMISLVLFSIVLQDYLSTGLVPRFPSLIAAVGSFAVAAQLWVTGMILERVKLNRNTMLQAIYRSWQNL